MKYRRLTTEELKDLEKPFTKYLATNGIPADDWVKIKANDTAKQEELIEYFSDLIFEQSLEKIEYLEFRSAREIQVFNCQTDKIVLMALQMEGNSPIDFRKENPSKENLDKIHEAGASLNVYSAEKKYAKERKQELFEMMEKGCLISNKSMFDALQQLNG